jgi:hypothetical protein
MSRRWQKVEGKAKILFEGPEPGTLVQHFKDEAAAWEASSRMAAPATARRRKRCTRRSAVQDKPW